MTTSPLRTLVVATCSWRCGRSLKNRYPYQAAPSTITGPRIRMMTFFMGRLQFLLGAARGVGRILQRHPVAFLHAAGDDNILFVALAHRDDACFELLAPG